ncbi:MAG TPA: hypothetical protein VLT33_48030 [Labilithrix sp.]|nr:hypothetical protein [Labilithrix sp.]
MKSVRPKPLGAPVGGAPLTPEEGFVLARIDGRLSVGDLVALTGIEEPRVQQIVTKLASRGAVLLEGLESPSSGYLPDLGSSPSLPDTGTTSLADFAAALGMDPSAFAAADTGRGAVEQPVREARVESRSNYPAPATTETTSEVIAIAEPAPASEPESGDQLIEVRDEEEAAAEPDEDATANAAADNEESEEARAAKEQDYRKLYESRFHVLTVDVRIGLAKVVHGTDLLALCLDADTRVIAAILENATCGLQHVRLIALYHRTATGLEILTRRNDFLRDMLVERRLLRNPQAGDTVLGRVFASKRVFQTYKIAIDRDVPELTRAKGRGFLRQKFGSSPPEERADLVIRTEGRCLVLMTGCTFDAKTTGILCGRPYNSVLFIQNLAKFSATPPALLAHLVKQPFVRKIAPLKKLLLQHPNMPGDVKRQL